MAKKPTAAARAAQMNEDEATAHRERLIEAQEAAKELSASSLTAGIRDFILDRLKQEQNKRPWHERSEYDQRDTVQAVEAAVRELTQKAIEIIASGGMNTMIATLEQVTVKDGIKATLTMSKHDLQRHALIDSTGATVMIVVADVSEFERDNPPVPIKLDQGTLIDGAVVHADVGRDTPFN